MKLIFVVLFVAFAASFASSTLTGLIEGEYILEPFGTDDVIYANEYYEPEMFSTAFGSFNDYFVAEDFIPVGSDFDVTDVTWWIITTGSEPIPYSLEILFYADAAPGPGALLWSGEPSDLVLVDTGVTFAGFVIFEATATLPDTDYFTAVDGTQYWVSMHRTDGETLYIILDSVVEGTESYRIVEAAGPWVAGSTTGDPPYDPTDVFQVIEGTPLGALENETWGTIKVLF